MRRVDYGYSKYHNKKYGLSGHAFDGPYKAFPQGTWINILYKIAYIFLNPVTAGMVPHPGAYRWSGYSSFMGLKGSPLAVTSAPALDRLSKDPSEARKGFLRIMEREQLLLRRRPPPPCPARRCWAANSKASRIMPSRRGPVEIWTPWTSRSSGACGRAFPLG